ncbi:PTS sugar transporter subunit IIB [Oceanobacillus sp. FSL W8-0428]|uniref:PTS sugar transporter subunit IIB n=1 Tax=Oceanobacillus aidingensis TaxID=645964 RepID=A0ABV9JTS0_9BACI|nr:PTS sugar transporter subunit IIB [Oceanobacillus oncorhynchi]MDM8101086.1 PTS sugar transporter subunit IIB [Oceanobacillus oncorhynchi]UUI40722.1 PTS sugar transporter subunit IIB [Oceanobacillus oncorhynchi]GIO18947.1 PTS sugar transporter subunit IIB [Oceanobacillus oncorhynchi subsp. incaldanensis]
MEKVIVVCEAGITTSLLVKKLNELAQEKGQGIDIQSKSLEEGLDYVKEHNIDVVLLGPQIHHSAENYEASTNAKVAKISVKDYNSMNVYSIFEQIREA